MKNFRVEYQIIVVDGDYQHTDKFSKMYRVRQAETAKSLCEAELQTAILKKPKKKSRNVRFSILSITEE